jgi:hypothetical protein
MLPGPQRHVYMQKYGIANRRRNDTSSNFFVYDPYVIAQDKEEAECDKRINRRISEMGFKCKYS